ncbi:MAG: 1-acyl-sn-glycerol-3-phosphate acyltransferase [Balneolaceae bacterium]|nr:1-acyl-sn-glycerol-3-phosphate acyltransferase [Balneolaceae bacterium]
MKSGRAFLKLIVFLAGTLFFYALIMMVAFLSLLGLNYEFHRSHLLNKWGKFACTVLGMQITVKGTPPGPPFFLVSNHLSYIDVFLLFSKVRGLFIAKSDVKSWPLIGSIIKSCGILFIDREKRRDITRVNRLIQHNITEDQGIIMFPESTTSDGKEVLPFRSSLLQYPAEVKMPVSYAVINYSTGDGEEPASKAVCWWTETPFFVHFFNLLKLKKISAHITFGDQKVIMNNRKTLSKKLEECVRSDFIPVTK